MPLYTVQKWQSKGERLRSAKGMLLLHLDQAQKLNQDGGHVQSLGREGQGLVALLRESPRGHHVVIIDVHMQLRFTFKIEAGFYRKNGYWGSWSKKRKLESKVLMDVGGHCPACPTDHLKF